MNVLEHFEKYINKEERIPKLQEKARSNWDTNFKPQEFIRALDICAKVIDKALNLGPSEQLNQQIFTIFTYFKDNRRPGTALRASIYLLDSRHEMPEQLDPFLTNLGQLNDYLQNYLEQGNVESLQNAQVFIFNLKNILSESTIFTFSKDLPANPNSIINYVAEALDYVAKNIETENLSAPDAHMIRKKLRAILNIYSLALQIEPNKKKNKVAAIFEALKEIVDELGVVQNEVVQRDISNHLDYNQQVVNLNPELIAKIRLVLPNRPRD